MNCALLEFEKHLAFPVFPGTGDGMNADRTKVLMLSVSQGCRTKMQPPNRLSWRHHFPPCVQRRVELYNGIYDLFN